MTSEHVTHVTLQPKEAGPFEEIARRLALSEIGGPEAMRQSAALAAQGALTIRRGEVLRLLAIAQLQADRWVLAVQVYQVLWAAVDAAVPDAPVDLLRTLPAPWLDIASRGVWETGDPRLYHDALARGIAGFDAATARGDRAGAADIAFRIGALHLDAYVLHRGVHEAEATAAFWARRQRAGQTWDGERLPATPQGAFPDLARAMRSAHEWLARAVETGGDPLQTHKALALAMHARRQIEGDAACSVDEIAAVVREAAARFADVNDPVRLVEVLAVGADAGVPLDRARLAGALDGSLEPLFDRYPVGDVVMMLRNGALALRRAGAGAEAFSLIARATPSVEPRLDERDLGGWYPVVNNAIRDRSVTPFAALASEQTIADAWSAFLSEVGTGQRSPELGLTVALQMADRCRPGEEFQVVAMLELALAMSPPMAERYGRSIHYLMALASRQGANRAARAGGVDRAVTLALRAVFDGLRSREPDVRNAALIDLSRWMPDATAEGISAAGEFLWRFLPFLEAELGEGDAEILYDILGSACLAAVRTLPAAATVPLIRLAKGYRFGAAVRAGAARRLVPDETARFTAERAETAMREHPDADLEDSSRQAMLRELLLVTPVVRSKVVSGGGTAADRLRNLRHRADVCLEAAIGRTAIASLAAADAVRQPAIDVGPDTVVLEFLLTRVGEQQVVIRLATWDAEHRVSATMLGAGSAPGPRVIESLVLHLREVGAAVLHLRRALQDDPAAGAPTSSDAEVRLQELSERLLGDFGPLLTTLHQAGKRALVIVPHAALHVAPLHLLPVDGVPLAERWTVTFAPTSWVLVPDDPATPAEARLAGAAWGVSFADGAFGLAPLDNVPAEVTTIASLLDGPCWLDHEATAATLQRALTTARCVHVATHGMHDATAPSYHTLFCSPADGGSGRVYARDLLGLDLRGVDLVTMSACETALGRFDFGDNLRGIPSALLQGGAGAIIGCLWDVETRVAETFFAALYGELAEGGSQVAAFAAAQRQTRRRFPAHRDWGAFYYLAGATRSAAPRAPSPSSPPPRDSSAARTS